MRHSTTLIFYILTFILSFLIFIFPTSSILASSSSLFFSAPPTQIKEGERVTIDVKINSSEKSINAISGILSFPVELVRVISLNKEKSIINLWTQEPKLSSNRILFEGIVLNPGFQGNNGLIFRVTLEAKKSGVVNLNWNEGSVLANDGRGSNVLVALDSVNFKIISNPTYFDNKIIVNVPNKKIVILPVITDYTELVNTTDTLYVKGKGEPNSITKIIFKDISIKSIGEKLIGTLQTKKKKLDEVLVKNDKLGIFEYVSAKNLVAGVYNATPFLVDEETNTEKPGFGIQFLVNDSPIVTLSPSFICVGGALKNKDEEEAKIEDVGNMKIKKDKMKVRI